uniref:Kynureninase n=1 Tax=Heterorhabditis bacteriophora TaxID=37862 RepID=A0A1I7XU79_HETBA
MDKRERMLGWWGHRMATRFNMDNVLDLESGASGYRLSNPPIHLVVPVMGMLEVLKTVSLEDLRSRSCYLTGYLEFLIDHFFAEDSQYRTNKISCSLITPRDFNQRGCQLSLKFNVSIDVIYEELVKRGVAVDKRHPNVIRVSPVHLYNNYVDCRRFVTALQDSCTVAELTLGL